VAETRADIPDQDVFKASEVCAIASVRPYVLRSWEQEFPAIGAARTSGGPRVYRRADVELVLRIKDLVFGEGLTLAGARRRIEQEAEPEGGAAAAEAAPPVAAGARAALAEVKQQLRSLLDMLERRPPGSGTSGWPPAAGNLLEFTREPKAADPADTEARKAASKKKPVRPVAPRD